MLFKQLFDQDTWTYSYLIADSATREAVIIDPVVERVDRDLKLIDELGLDLIYSLDTHVHADHVTGSGELRARTGALTVLSKAAEVGCADHSVVHGERLQFGAHEIEVRSTPGHTDGCVTYIVHTNEETMAFTGDALFIRGSGRTDFQQGDSATLYHSVHNQIFSLPDDTVVYPGHDYRGHSTSTVGEEKAHNPRLNLGVTEDQFVEIMSNLNLSNPKMMDVAVPANLICGNTSSTDGPAPKMREVTPETLTDIGRYRVIDVRQPEEFHGQVGHIEGAELVPLATMPGIAGQWPKEERLLMVCRTGGRSTSAAEVLLHMGFEDVTNLNGGMLAWNQAHELRPAGGQP